MTGLSSTCDYVQLHCPTGRLQQSRSSWSDGRNSWHCSDSGGSSYSDPSLSFSAVPGTAMSPFEALSHSSFGLTIWGKYYCFPLFYTQGNWDTESLSNKVTLPVSRSGWSPSLCSKLWASLAICIECCFHTYTWLCCTVIQRQPIFFILTWPFAI